MYIILSDCSRLSCMCFLAPKLWALVHHTMLHVPFTGPALYRRHCVTVQPENKMKVKMAVNAFDDPEMLCE